MPTRSQLLPLLILTAAFSLPAYAAPENTAAQPCGGSATTSAQAPCSLTAIQATNSQAPAASPIEPTIDTEAAFPAAGATNTLGIPGVSIIVLLATAFFALLLLPRGRRRTGFYEPIRGERPGIPVHLLPRRDRVAI